MDYKSQYLKRIYNDKSNVPIEPSNPKRSKIFNSEPYKHNENIFVFKLTYQALNLFNNYFT